MADSNAIGSSDGAMVSHKGFKSLQKSLVLYSQPR